MSESSVAAGPVAQSPLAGITADPAAAPVAMSERPYVKLVNLRGKPGDETFLQACERHLGVSLPLQPNRCSEDGAAGACWLGPDEWLVWTGADGWGTRLQSLQAALQGRHFALNEIGAGYTTIRLAGPQAADLIARGCSLDLHPARFAVGDCAQTHIAKALVLLIKVEDTPVFDVLVRRSFADYLWRWLDHVNRRLLPYA